MWRSQIRNVSTFFLGAAGFVHELLFVATERPFVLTASLALMGFPFVLGAEAKIRRKDEE